MYTPQAGIFALGTSSHAYLEFDILDAKKSREFASTISAIREPRTTTGGVNFVIGWKHKVTEWEALPVKQQELIMGRTKPDSIELENKPADSHVASTDQDKFGNIFRRNMPYGNVDDHGTMFVGFSADQKRLSKMLDSMAGLITGTRDALTRYTQPLTGSYYFVPSVETLRRLR
jgi:putative iron-dependent peroxidase